MEVIAYDARFADRAHGDPRRFCHWMVDPDIDAIRVYTRDGDRFARALELSSEAGDVLTTPLLPGLEIPLSRVFME